MANKIEVLDAIMGSGKSTSVLEWVDSNPDKCFLYVTPLLSESEVRVVEACKINKFSAPETNNKGETKSSVLLDMLSSGVNISITQSLYSLLRKEHLDLIELNNYTLILDEEVNFITPLDKAYTQNDFKYLEKSKSIMVDEGGKLVWLDNNILEDTKYYKLATMCNLGMIYQSKRRDSWFVTQLPIELIKRADRVILMTYLFDGSILDSFLQLKGIGVVPFTEVSVRDISKESIRELITFVGERQVRDWSSESMSSTWYTDASQQTLTKLAKDIRSIGNSEKAKSGELLWCVPSSLARPKKNGRKVAPQSYAAGDGKEVVGDFAVGNFLPCSSRATNAYRDRSVMIHCYNRFPHQSVAAFLQDFGYPVSRNQFALSEFLQWLWRSRIRDGLPIKVCILPKRMRKLFQDWLELD